MPPGPGDLFAAAQALLTASAAGVATSPGGPIDYQAIWPGLPAFDCAPAIHVHTGGASFADTYPLQPPLQPMQQIAMNGEVNLIVFTVTVLRCVPTVTQGQSSVLLPQVAAITESARITMGDLWAVWNHLKNQHRAGLLFQTPSGRREFRFLPAVPLRTSGGVGGWEIQVAVELSGYSE